MFEVCKIFTGVVVGYLVVSICESYFHRTVGHMSARFRKLCRSSRLLDFFALRTWYSHSVIHHFGTYRDNHVSQFTGAEEKSRLRRKLAVRGREDIPAQDYGLRVGGPVDLVRYVLPTLPIWALACWIGGGWFSLGAIVPLIVMPLMSEFIHPLLHMTYEEANEAAPPLIKPLLTTRYFRWVVSHHWLHHRHLEVNFNLMPGGDYILRCHKAPTPAELAEMSAMGLFVGSRGAEFSKK